MVNDYSKSSWLRRDTELLLSEARARYCLEYPDKKPTDNNVIKAALKEYTKGAKNEVRPTKDKDRKGRKQ